ncbi:MAG: TonB-dependent receptor [Pedobacter sp.]|nr:TonB-dependent receptor [Pedobacter sp.]
MKNTDNNISEVQFAFETLATAIERNNQVKLYYKPEWFISKKINPSISTLPLEECLDAICRITGLSYVALNPTTYIFVPVEIRNYSNVMNNQGIILIGEPGDTLISKKATVTGRVLDFVTGKALDKARITIDKLNLNTTSDQEGSYKFTLPIGDYDLRINYVGYDEDYRKIRVYGNGIVDFEVSEKIIRLKEVVVTDRAVDLNVVRTQMSVINMNAKVIKELPGFLGQKDIIKSVTLLPGVQSTGEFGTGFFVRGGSSDQNLILVEDVPLFNSSHLFGLTSAINADAVSSATLLKAGIPAMYGERASSVMDIRLNSYANEFSAKGGIGLLDSRLNIELPLMNKKVSLFASGRTSYSNWLLHAMPDAELKNSSAGFYDLNALLRVNINQHDYLTVFGYVSDDRFSFTKNSPYQYDNLLASVKYTHVFNDKLSTSVLAGLSRYRNSITSSDSLKPDEAYLLNSSVLYRTAKMHWSWMPNRKQDINFGLNAVHYQLQQGALTPYGTQSEVIPHYTTERQGLEMSAYISDNFRFTPRISAEGGLRLNRYANLGPGSSLVFNPDGPRTSENITDTLNFSKNQLLKEYYSLEPRLSLRYSLDDFSSVKLSYSRISQVINLISNSTVMSPTDVYNLSSINVKPLINNQIAMGYFRNFDNNSIEASLEMYYKKTLNIVEYRDGANIIVNNSLEADLLNASGYSYGIEFFLKKNTGKLTGWLSYTYSRSMRYTSSVYLEDQINRNNIYASPNDIPHNFVLNAGYQLTRRWRVAGVFFYNTGKPVTLPELKYNYNGMQYVYYSDRNKYRLPDYHRFDISATIDESLKISQKWKGSWTFSILNLYARKNPYSVFYRSTSQVESRFYQSFNLYKMYIIDRPIPTITYQFSF